VLRRPWPVAIAGIAIVAVLAGLGTQMNPNEAQLKNFPGAGTAIAGRQQLADAGISPGVMKPLDVLVEHGGNAQAVADKLRGVKGIAGASAPSGWRNGQNSLVEAFPAIDGSAPGIQGVIVIGMQGCGVKTPSAAAVAAATCGLARLKHMPNGMMLTIEMWSMMLAAYWLPHITRLVGSTTRLDGVVPNEHISVALLTTCIGMAVPPIEDRLQHSAFCQDASYLPRSGSQ